MVQVGRVDWRNDPLRFQPSSRKKGGESCKLCQQSTTQKSQLVPRQKYNFVEEIRTAGLDKENKAGVSCCKNIIEREKEENTTGRWKQVGGVRKVNDKKHKIILKYGCYTLYCATTKMYDKTLQKQFAYYLLDKKIFMLNKSNQLYYTFTGRSSSTRQKKPVQDHIERSHNNIIVYTTSIEESSTTIHTKLNSSTTDYGTLLVQYSTLNSQFKKCCSD